MSHVTHACHVSHTIMPHHTSPAAAAAQSYRATPSPPTSTCSPKCNGFTVLFKHHSRGHLSCGVCIIRVDDGGGGVACAAAAAEHDDAAAGEGVIGVTHTVSEECNDV